jgi:DNA-binding NarL/FixJ family response regulator
MIRMGLRSQTNCRATRHSVISHLCFVIKIAVTAVLFLTSDLMFSSRLVSAARAHGVAISLVADQAALADKVAADCRLALIDLSLDRLNLPAAVRAIRTGAPAAQVVAYGPHVDEAALADAKEAGCDQVLTRGQFNKQYAELLAGVK